MRAARPARPKLTEPCFRPAVAVTFDGEVFATRADFVTSPGVPWHEEKPFVLKTFEHDGKIGDWHETWVGKSFRAAHPEIPIKSPTDTPQGAQQLSAAPPPPPQDGPPPPADEPPPLKPPPADEQPPMKKPYWLPVSTSTSSREGTRPAADAIGFEAAAGRRSGAQRGLRGPGALLTLVHESDVHENVPWLRRAVAALPCRITAPGDFGVLPHAHLLM